MDYIKLSSCCRRGWIKDIKRLIEGSVKEREVIDIFWGENELIHMAAIHGGAEVLSLLMEYYENHFLQGDPESNEYLHNRSLLTEAIEETIFSTGSVKPEVMEIFNVYRLPEDNKSEADLNEVPDSYDADNDIAPESSAVPNSAELHTHYSILGAVH
jgi:hypothetical protein